MFFSKFKREPLLWSLVAITVFLQFYRLAIGDLIAWDESLYVIRAKAILTFGVWLDQTEYALGGLYSSTHPPLAIWLMTLFVKLFGETLFVWRLVSALSAAFGLFFLYRLSRLHTSESASLIAVIALGNAQHYLWFGHHAQLDIPMHASVIAAVWLIARALRTDTLPKYVLAGVPIGIALLIKAFQGLYVVPFIIGCIVFSMTTRKLLKVGLVLGTASLIAAPWYLFIMSAQALYITDYFQLVGKISSGAYDSNAHPWWYYLNQLIVAVPLFFPFLLAFQGRNSQSGREANRFYVVAFGWVILMLVLMTGMGTKMAHWMPFLIIPSAIALPYLIDRFIGLTRNAQYICVALAAICTFWSLGLGVRNPRMVFSEQIEIDSILLISIVLPLLLLWYILSRKSEPILRVLLLLVTIIVGGNLYRWSHWNDSAFSHGARPTAALLDSIPEISDITVIHADFEFEDLYAEFSYYSNGWTLGWLPEKKYRALDWFEAVDSIKTEDFWSADAVVIHRVWDAFAKAPVRDSLALATLDASLRQHFKQYRRFARYEVYY